MRTFTNEDGNSIELSDAHLKRAIEIKLKLQELSPNGKRCKWQKLVSMMHAEGYTGAEATEAYRVVIKAEQKKLGKLPTEYDETLENVESDYKESINLMSDGSQASDKLLKLNSDQMKDAKYLLKAHGYDPTKWEMVKATNSMWNMYTKAQGKIINYSSKIIVKPLVEEFTIKDLAKSVLEVKPVSVVVKRIKEKAENMLLVSLFDLHFGINSFEDYMFTQERIAKRMEKNEYKEVLFIVGNDNFHHDNFRSTTASGTIIENVDMESAWDNAVEFYEPLIKQAVENGSDVKIIYVKGNHSESMEWAFVKYLGARFPTVEVDGTFEERKIHVYGESVLGFTHGDKRKKQIHNIFQADFPMQWGMAKDRAIYTGHLHHEQVFDEYGTVVRTLPTSGKTDKWHNDNGFIGANKRFQIFDYDLNGLSEIQYV